MVRMGPWFDLAALVADDAYLVFRTMNDDFPPSLVGGPEHTGYHPDSLNPAATTWASGRLTGSPMTRV